MSLNPVSLGIGGALSLAGLAYSAIKGGQANKANEALVNQQSEELEAWRNNNQNYLDTVQGQAQVKAQKEAMDQRVRSDEQKAVITGATDEAQLAARDSANRANAQTTEALAVQGNQYAQNVDAQYRTGVADIYRQRMGINQQKAANAQALGSNVGNLFGTSAYAGLFQRGDSTQEKVGTLSRDNWVRANDIAKYGKVVG